MADQRAGRSRRSFEPVRSTSGLFFPAGNNENVGGREKDEINYFGKRKEMGAIDTLKTSNAVCP